MDKGKTPIIENFHTPGSMGNILAWDDQPILEPLDDVADIESIAYDRKMHLLVKITQRKMKLTLDSIVIMTSEETCLMPRRLGSVNCWVWECPSLMPQLIEPEKKK